jgi:replicative DNA helicase
MSARDNLPFDPWAPEAPRLRVPPSSLEAEASVLGALLQDNRAFDRIPELTEADFFRAEHRAVFGAIADLLRAGKPADVVTVYDRLGAKAEEAGGFALLNSLTQTVPSASNIGRYAAIVLERSRLRAVIGTCDEITTLAYAGQTAPEALIDAAQQRILAIGEGEKAGDGWVGVYEGMLEHTGLLDRRHNGEVTAWPTGLSDLDEYLEGGLRPGELVIVGARPSMGKTALGLSIGVHMAATHPVGFLSMEMSQSEVRDRLTAMLGSVSLSSVKRPARGEGLAWDRVSEGVERAKELRLTISERGGLNINQVRTMARALKRKGGLEVLVVDYIGLMTGLDPRANRNTQLGEISRGLKTLAKELQVCVLCLAQLNRGVESRPDAMPQMSDLRDSGEIEQDADVILFIKRPIMANPDLGPDWQHYAKLSVAKNRQGRCGYLDLSYLGEQTKFTGWSGPAPQKAGAAPANQQRGMA